MTVDASGTDDVRRAKRALRARIARSRRRVDRDLAATVSATRGLADWRRYVRRFPGAAMGVSFVAGLALSSGMVRRGVVHFAGARVLHLALAGVERRLMSEALAWWNESRRDTESDGRD